MILDRLQKNQRVSSTALIHELNVSEGTIRRDLNELQESGLLQKVHGGAVPRPEAPRVFAGRKDYASESKNLLAIKAVSLLREGQLILIDGGTSNWHMARQIPTGIRLTVVTNSLPIASELTDHPNIDLFVLGGRVFKGARVTLDIQSSDLLDEIHADLAFIGIRSIHPQKGLTTLELEEARLKRHMVRSSEKTVVLCTNDKLNTSDQYSICGIDELDILIAEDTADPDILETYRKLGIEIL